MHNLHFASDNVLLYLCICKFISPYSNGNCYHHIYNEKSATRYSGRFKHNRTIVCIIYTVIRSEEYLKVNRRN